MLLFEAYWEKGGSRSGPVFSTSDRRLAWEFCTVAERAVTYSGGAGDLVFIMVQDGCVLKDEPDWHHPDFPREKQRIPIKADT